MSWGISLYKSIFFFFFFNLTLLLYHHHFEDLIPFPSCQRICLFHLAFHNALLFILPFVCLLITDYQYMNCFVGAGARWDFSPTISFLSSISCCFFFLLNGAMHNGWSTCQVDICLWMFGSETRANPQIVKYSVHWNVHYPFLVWNFIF